MLNQDSAIIRLINLGLIRKEAIRGHYLIVALNRSGVKRPEIINLYCNSWGVNRLTLKEDIINQHLAQLGRPPMHRPMRRLNIYSYGSSNHGMQNDWINNALNRIPVDSDGVRRSFGVEYEIYSMTSQQQSDLAYLLDTLPAHTCNHDGSLGCSGVEIVFAPVGEAEYIRIVNTLKEFVTSHRITMNCGSLDQGAGMHTTFGVSNSEIGDKLDLQMRINRVMVMLRACMTKSAIRKVFGRFFTGYASLPSNYEMTTQCHSMAASTNGRPKCCWEFRLPNWRADPEKVVKFLKATEWAFHRLPTGDDMVKLVKMLADWNTEA